MRLHCDSEQGSYNKKFSRVDTVFFHIAHDLDSVAQHHGLLKQHRDSIQDIAGY